MSISIRVLVVEDDREMQNSWDAVFEAHNADPESKFSVHHFFADSKEAATSALFFSKFDVAIVDLRLRQNGNSTDNTDGNAVVESLIETEMMVIAVITGEPRGVEIPDWARKQIKVITKGADENGTPSTDQFMQWLAEQAGMIGAIQAAQQTIRGEMAKLFAHSIWPRWRGWIQDSPSPADLHHALGRHWISHTHEVLMDQADHSALPEEWYFVPPVRDGIRTGDIIRDKKGAYWVVITPRCDFATGKAENINLLLCEEHIENWNTWEKHISGEDKNLKDKATEKRKNFINNDHNKSSRHFLPRVTLKEGNPAGPFLVRFDIINSINVADKDNINHIKSNRIAAINTEHLPALVERFGAFFSRIGAPNYSF